jgi:hypothetical protein
MVVYVGRTKDFEKRKTQHFRADQPWDICVWYRDMKYLGFSPIIHVLELVNSTAVESVYFNKFKSLGMPLLNSNKIRYRNM